MSEARTIAAAYLAEGGSVEEIAERIVSDALADIGNLEATLEAERREKELFRRCNSLGFTRGRIRAPIPAKPPKVRVDPIEP